MRAKRDFNAGFCDYFSQPLFLMSKGFLKNGLQPVFGVERRLGATGCPSNVIRSFTASGLTNLKRFASGWYGKSENNRWSLALCLESGGSVRTARERYGRFINWS